MGGFSQHGEDVFLARYFDDKSEGCYIEIGANNPVFLNSTYLLYLKGWRGTVVDPIQRFQKLFCRYRPGDVFLNAAAGTAEGVMDFFEIIPDVFSTSDPERARKLQEGGALLWKSYRVPVRSLASIIGDSGNSNIDFLSVDVEGRDHDVLASNDWQKYRPRLISCEIDKWQGYQKFFQSIGYKEVALIGCNAFYEDC